jgi:phosphoinositide-3-kinase regulatory subunit 4
MHFARTTDLPALYSVDREALLDIANVYNYQAFVETEKAGYLIRQWIASNLYDRIRCVVRLQCVRKSLPNITPSTRPFLSVIEKKWIAFQLLTALSLAHLQKTPHGDIKSTNILVTSSNWTYLTDFAPYKPTRLPLDDPADFSFFFDTSGRRTCYVAPERFYKADKDEKGRTDEESERKERVTEAMDVFSAGCVIAEMFLEGAPLFTLSQLFKYREGEYSVEAQLGAIEEEGIRVSSTCLTQDSHNRRELILGTKALIKQMISLDPTSRPTFEVTLSGARGEVFPECFYSFLHEYVASISERSTLYPVSSSFSSSHAPPTTLATAISPTSTVKGNKEPATTVGEALPSDSDHRVDRIWEDYANIEPFLLHEQDVERTVMDVRVDYGTTTTSSFKLHQVKTSLRFTA